MPARAPELATRLGVAAPVAPGRRGTNAARATGTPLRPRQRSPATPPTPDTASPRGRVSHREVAELSRYVLEEEGPTLRCLHTQALAGQVDITALEATSHAQRRARAADFFAEGFQAHGLRDEWFVALVALLDRVAVATEQPRWSAQHRKKSSQEAYAEWMAAVLIVLKQSQCEAEMDTSPRDVVFRVSHVSKEEFMKVWPHIVQAEFRIYRALDYRVALPTALDLALHTALVVCSRTQCGVAMGEAPAAKRTLWPGFAEGCLPAPRPGFCAPLPRLALLAAYLVEVSVVHAHEDVYASGATPLALALACVRLALHGFGEPPAQCVQALEAAQQEAVPPEGQQAQCLEKAVRALVERVHELWAQPPSESKIARKWRSRVSDLGDPLPFAPKEVPPAVWSMGQAAQVFRTPHRRLVLVTRSRSLSRTKQRPSAPVSAGLADIASPPAVSSSPPPRRASKVRKVPMTPEATVLPVGPAKAGRASPSTAPQGPPAAPSTWEGTPGAPAAPLVKQDLATAAPAGKAMAPFRVAIAQGEARPSTTIAEASCEPLAVPAGQTLATPATAVHPVAAAAQAPEDGRWPPAALPPDAPAAAAAASAAAPPEPAARGSSHPDAPAVEPAVSASAREAMGAASNAAEGGPPALELAPSEPPADMAPPTVAPAAVAELAAATGVESPASAVAVSGAAVLPSAVVPVATAEAQAPVATGVPSHEAMFTFADKLGFPAQDKKSLLKRRRSEQYSLDVDGALPVVGAGALSSAKPMAVAAVVTRASTSCAQQPRVKRWRWAQTKLVAQQTAC